MKEKKKKSVARLPIFILIVLGLFYSGLWFYTAREIENRAIEAIEDINGEYSINIRYSNLSVSGFPLNLVINVKDLGITTQVPGLDSTENSYKLSYKFVNNTALETGIFDKITRLTLPEKIQLSMAQESVRKFDMTYMTPPIIELELAKSPFDFLISSFDMVPWQLDRIKEHFVGLEYRDFGIKGYDAVTDKEMFVSDDSVIKITAIKIDDKKREIHLEASADSVEITDGYYDFIYGGMVVTDPFQRRMFDWIKEENKKKGKVAYNIDITYKGSLDYKKLLAQPDFDLTIKQIVWQNDLYAFNGDGNISMDIELPMPYGWLRISLHNYKHIINYYANMYNKLILTEIRQGLINEGKKDQAESYKRISQEQLSSLDVVIEHIADVNGNDLTLLLKMGKGSFPTIGDVPIMEVMMMVQNVLMPPPVIEPPTSQEASPPTESSSSPMIEE